MGTQDGMELWNIGQGRASQREAGPNREQEKWKDKGQGEKKQG